MYVRVTPMESNEQRGIGIENESKRSNGTVNFDRKAPTEKSGPPLKINPIFRNFSVWTIHSVLDRNFWKFWLNGSRPRKHGFKPAMSARVCLGYFANEYLTDHIYDQS